MSRMVKPSKRSAPVEDMRMPPPPAPEARDPFDAWLWLLFVEGGRGGTTPSAVEGALSVTRLPLMAAFPGTAGTVLSSERSGGGSTRETRAGSGGEGSTSRVAGADSSSGATAGDAPPATCAAAAEAAAIPVAASKAASSFPPTPVRRRRLARLDPSDPELVAAWDAESCTTGTDVGVPPANARPESERRRNAPPPPTTIKELRRPP